MEKHLPAVKDKVHRFFSTQFFREHQNKKSENVSGDKIFESQNVYNSFDIINARDIHYCETLKGPIHNCYDVSSFGINSSFCFESVTIGHHANNVNFCSECWENVTNLWYCLYCNKGVRDSFLCTGLKQKAEHCILNKPYSEQEYGQIC
ncbi:hypothetical protein H6768_06455 [Candidatus Peribacteria bacterium]|nr:hypothetical protein [Candidatus Peribacteria bacterium]